MSSNVRTGSLGVGTLGTGSLGTPGLNIGGATTVGGANLAAIRNRSGRNTGGFLGAVARNFADIVTSLPAAAVLGGRLAATGVSYGTPLGIASELGAPGTGWLRSFNRGSVDQAITAGRAIVEDYRYRYGPLAPGGTPPSTTWERFLERPLDYGLDLAAGYGAIGRGAATAGRAAGFGPSGRFAVPPGTGNSAQRFLSYLADVDPGGRRRARSDRLIPVPAAYAGAEALREVPLARRAGSINPITNAVQQRLDRLVDRRDAASFFQRGPQRVGSEQTGFALPGSALARYNRANARIGQTIRLQATDEARRDFVQTSRDYQRLIRRMGPIRTRIKGREGWEDALYLHATGMLDYRRLGFDTPQEALQGAIDFWEQGIAEARQAKQRTGRSEKALEQMRSLMDRPDLLERDNLPEPLAAAVDEAQRIIAEGQRRLDAGEEKVSRATGLLTRDQIEFSRVRRARQTHGQSTYVPEGFVDVERRVWTDEGPASVRELEARRRELLAEVQRIRQPAARQEALRAAQAAERRVQEGVAAYIRGNREEGRRLISEARESLRQLAEASEARLPGSGELSEGAYQRVVERSREITDDDLRARLSETEGAIADLQRRLEGADEGILRADAPAIPDDPVALFRDSLEALPRGREVADVQARLAEIRDRYPRTRSDAVRARLHLEIAQLHGFDLPTLRGELRRAEAAVETAAQQGARAVDQARAWADAVREALRIAVTERLALASPDAREALMRAVENPDLNLPGPEGALPIRRADELRAARAEMEALQDRAEILRMGLEGTRPSDAVGLERRAGALERQAADLRRPHQGYLIDMARVVRDSYQPRKGERPKFTGDEQQAYRGDNAPHRNRVRFNPEHFRRDGTDLTLAEYAENFLMELRYHVSQGVYAPDEATLRMLDDLDRADELEAVARRDRDALRELNTDEADWLQDPANLDKARAYLASEAQGQAMLDALERLKAELAGDLATSFTETVRMRQIRNRNAQARTGPEVVVPAGQRARGARQARRMFGAGAGVPRSRSGPAPDPAGKTPVEAAVADLGSGQMRAWAALERMLPADLAAEHRAAIAAVHQDLGAARASFGGTPAEMAEALGELRRIRRALGQARKRATVNWTTPRPVEALHSSIPQTGEMAEALAGMKRLRDQREDIIERLLDAERGGLPDGVPEVLTLQNRLAALDARIRKAEVSYHELETAEAIKLWGEFGDPMGAYWPDRPRRGQSPRPETDDRGGRPRPQNRLTAERIYANSGRLHREFNVSTSRRDPLYVLMRGVRAEHTADALLALMERAGVRWAEDRRDADGRLVGKADDLVRGDKTLELMKQSPELFRAVHVPTLQNTLERLRRETPDGEWPEQSVLEAAFARSDTEGIATVERAIVSGDWRADDVVLIPAKAVDEYVDAAHGIFRGYDNVLGVWKAGVLVFTPRWYVYNLVGNLAQYGVLSGGDIRSILLAGLGKYVAPTKAMRARYREIENRMREATPEEVASVSQASETGIAEGVSTLGRVAERLFEFNQGLEGVIRRAAYINSAKRQLKYQGQRGRTRRADDLADALDELDDAAREEALHEALLFLGDYRRFNKFERGFVRRVVPFYSWLRVIHRLTLGLPFKSPLRAEVLALAGEAARAQFDPLEEAQELARPLFARGALDIPEGVPVIGGLTLRTNQLNPFATTTEVLPDVLYAASQGPSAAVGAALQGVGQSVSPFVAPVAEALTPGYQLFGNRAVNAPPGYGGLIQEFGGRFLRPTVDGYEPVSGPGVPVFENFLQSVLPYYGSAVRQLLSGGRRPYDTATTPSLVAERLGFGGRIPGLYDARGGQVFRPENPEFPRLSSDAYPIGPLTALLGFPLFERNLDAELENALREIEEEDAAAEQTQRRFLNRLALEP